MKIVILGPSCFGLALGRYALNLGHDVHAIGRSPLRPVFACGYPPERYHEINVRDVYHVLSILKPEVIVNFAAQGEGAASFDPQTWHMFYDTNASSLARLSGKLINAPWLRRFIQIGSSEVYGSVDAPAGEDAPIRASSPYSASKAAFDLHLQAIHKSHGFPALIVRPSNGYCAGQQLHRVIPRALLSGLTGERLPLHGGGRSRKSYVSGDDLSRAILLLAEAGKDGEVYNVGPLEPVSIRRLLELCAQCLGMKFYELVEEAPERTGQDGQYWLDTSKIRDLGWRDEVPLLGGISGVHGWVKENLTELSHQPIEYQLRP